MTQNISYSARAWDVRRKRAIPGIEARVKHWTEQISEHDARRAQLAKSNKEQATKTDEEAKKHKAFLQSNLDKAKADLANTQANVGKGWSHLHRTEKKPAS